MFRKLFGPLFSNRKKLLRQDGRRARLEVEPLEDRRVPAATPLAFVKNHVLEIPGMPGVDNVTVIENVQTGKVTVVHNGNQQVFNTAAFVKVHSSLGNGGDLFDASQLFTKPVDVNGGYGNDKLFGGGQNDRLIGSWGNDWLVGNLGHDYLAGQWGLDTYWTGDDTIVDGASIVHYDPKDGPAYVYNPAPPAPTSYVPGAGNTLKTASPLTTSHQNVTATGEYVAIRFNLYAPAFKPSTAFSVTVDGPGTDLRLYRSDPNATDNVSTLVPTTIITNANGSRTLVFNYQVPQQTAVAYEIRALSSNGSAITLSLLNVEVDTLETNLEIILENHINS